MCITALCDCVIHNGKSNVKFKYFFVCGNKINLKDGLKKGDGGFISFIDDKTCISWTPDIYIKPIQFYIPEPLISNGIIKIIEVNPEQTSNTLNKTFKYKFTLKQNYAQRIANHAFAHPVRVGVDFVKK